MKFNAGKINDITLHTLSIPIPDEVLERRSARRRTLWLALARRPCISPPAAMQPTR